MPVQAQILQNGSFENVWQLPTRLPDKKDFSLAVTGDSWVNITTGCDGYGTGQLQISNPNPPNQCWSWYIPTYGSADYYSRRITETECYHVTVPLIQLDEGITDNNLKEYREAYEYESNPLNNNAYCGIYIRDYVFGYGGQQYREYIQTSLFNPLLPNHTYRVSFRASSAKNTGYASEKPNGYIKKLGAYLSSTSVLNYSGEWGTQYCGTLYDPNSYGIHDGIYTYLYIKPQIQSKNLSGDFASQTPPNQGLGAWQLVAGYITVPEDKIYNYLTIGYFEPNMNDFVWSQGVEQKYPKIAYYFIDSVNIVDVTSSPCLCSYPVYEFSAESKKEQTDSTKCCYTWTLKVPPSSDNVICPILNYKITYIWNSGSQITEEIVVPYDPLGRPVSKDNIGVSGEFCVNKPNNIGAYGNNHIRIEYQTTNGVCFDELDVICNCNCTDFSDPEIDMKLINKKSSLQIVGKCCYDIWFENTSDCHLPWKEFPRLDITSIGTNELPDLYPRDWLVQSTLSYRWFQRPPDYIVMPFTKFHVGTICIPQDGIVYDYLIDYTETENDSGRTICKKENLSLQCKTAAEICCDDIDALALKWSGKETNRYDIVWSQIDAKDHCEIALVEIFEENSTTSIWQTPSGTVLGSTGPCYKLLTSVVRTPGINWLKICFYAADESLICCKEVYFDQFSIFRKGNGISININSEKTDIIKNNLFPDPVESEFNLNLIVSEKSLYKINIFNSLGENVLNVFNGELENSEEYHYKIDLNNYPSGNYFVLISSRNISKSIPFILLK